MPLSSSTISMCASDFTRTPRLLWPSRPSLITHTIEFGPDLGQWRRYRKGWSPQKQFRNKILQLGKTREKFQGHNRCCGGQVIGCDASFRSTGKTDAEVLDQ